MVWPNVDMYSDWKEWARAVLTSLTTNTSPNPGELNKFSKDKLPSASRTQTILIYVHDATGGAVPAYSDGTDWRRVTDGTVIN